MKYYDFAKARKLCRVRKPITASLEMAEDEFWTAQEVWRDGKWILPKGVKTIAGIAGSSWATPTLRMAFPDGSTTAEDCFTLPPSPLRSIK